MNKFETLMPGYNRHYITQYLEDLNTSCEHYYIDANGNGTTNILANVPITRGEYYDTCKAYFDVKFNGQHIRVFGEMTLENWDADESTYQIESFDPAGWEYRDKTTAKQRYASKAQVVKTFWLHKTNDADIIEQLGKQASASKYIKDLIRADIKRDK